MNESGFVVELGGSYRTMPIRNSEACFFFEPTDHGPLKTHRRRNNEPPRMTSKPITRLQKYDSAGGCKGIDQEFFLPACTSSDLISSEEFKGFAHKFRKECCVYRYGREDGGEVETLFPQSDRESAALIWNARPDVRDLFESAGRKLRRDWTLGERVAWTILQLQARGLWRSRPLAASSSCRSPPCPISREGSG
ncbi:hypothetical protein DL764_006936 [Monosporascus ibericus]|uniref:Uncharacterized protein n=1 Tax=Monosporascus ibericus TaxID=155417 RepID=A0A4Q4T6Z7_9PEZI|nr:hypothetical protein DL764_006936 [Monosporascus ibericus]